MWNLQRRVHNKSARELALALEEAADEPRPEAQIHAHELPLLGCHPMQLVVDQQLFGRAAHAVPHEHLRLEILHDRLLLHVHVFLHHLVHDLAHSDLDRLLNQVRASQSIDCDSVQILRDYIHVYFMFMFFVGVITTRVSFANIWVFFFLFVSSNVFFFIYKTRVIVKKFVSVSSL